MPQIAQRLREPAAFVLLAYAGLSTLFYTIDFLFAPGQTCEGSFCSGPGFSDRAPTALDQLTSPLLVIVLLAILFVAHAGTPLKTAKAVTLVALIVAAVALLFGVVALFVSFGSHEPGWSKTEEFFIGLAQAATLALATWFISGYYQKYLPAKPAAGFPGQPPQGFQQPQWQQPGQWQQPQGQPQAPQPQGQPPQWGQPPQGQPQPPQPQQGQPWGPPPPPMPPTQQQGFSGGGSESLMTQAIPGMQPPMAPQPPPAPSATETTAFPPVGNWTTDG